MVYVLDNNGQPLMPTDRHGKVHRLLNSNKAKVVNDCPFTIQLMYETGHCVQHVSLGIDAGTRHIGVSATTDTEELYASEVTPRSDITKLLSQKRELRHGRRSRKTRYRKPRFNNRIRSKHKGWLAPSVEAVINTHIREAECVCSILPIRSITIETAQFDTQLLKAEMLGHPLPEGTDYQYGEQMGFWNTREYVLWRDDHKCQCCGGKSGDSILNVHHIESRQTGGDSPDNLVTLCETCHKGYHAGMIELPESIKRHHPLKDATKMGIMRWTLYNRLKEQLSADGIDVHMTYGYITKNTRIRHGLEKSHTVDARCISSNPGAKPLGYAYVKKKTRCHNRKLHKTNIVKGGIRKANQSAKTVFGFRLFDKVRYKEHECFIFGKRTSGYFDIRTIDGKTVHNSASYRNICLIRHNDYMMIERRTA